jgi:hypothetical protein
VTASDAPCPAPATRGLWRRKSLILVLPCLTCAGQLPVLLAVLAVTGWAGPLSLYVGIASAVLGAGFVGLVTWGARVLSRGEETKTP